MIGTIIGDIAGAPYEMWMLKQDKRNYKPLFLYQLAKFTDDTNLTIATADALISNKPYHEKYLEWYRKNPNLGYGSGFVEWAVNGGVERRDSYANGAAMRISPIVLFALRASTNTLDGDIIPLNPDMQLEWLLEQTATSTEWTHNHEEARNGAMAVSLAMFLAAKGMSKSEIKEWVEDLTQYTLTDTVQTIRDSWDKRNIRCSITVPQALICFLESTDFESAIRNAVYSGGDCDTIAAMAGGIAEHFYGVESIDPQLLKETKSRLQPEMIEIINKCYDGKLNW